MFKVDRTNNRLIRLERQRFADLHLRERDHLQEWLVNMPDALGEELLILQKEFDGFAETRERLDLLALDKDRRLVVIENKLDDSGRDVVWQALKYAAYCASLTKMQIIDLYQAYLNRWSEREKADDKLREFLDVEDMDEVVLNPGGEPRLILIAANFRKEVTSTVLWLLKHNVQVQCFRVVPHGFEDDLFVDLQQIIPPPDAADYMVRMAAKDSEEETTQGAYQRTQETRYQFWTQALEGLRVRGLARFENISPSKEYWLGCATGVSGCRFQLIFSRREIGVELAIARPEAEHNKRIFDQLAVRRQQIEDAFGVALDWRRMDEHKSSIVGYRVGRDDCFDPETWPEIVEWMCQHADKLAKAFAGPLAGLDQ